MHTHILAVAAATVILAAAHTAHAGKVLFYMHGSDVHGKSTDHKTVKNYQKIVQHLEEQGLEVVFEARPTPAAEDEAARTAKMVQDRIAAGTAPEDIIVGGFSYGSMIALKVAGLIGNDKVNYALFCGCPESPGVQVDIDFAAVKGRVLSVVDTDDAKFGTCEGRLPNATSLTEETITSGKGHKVFKQTKAKFLNAWVPRFVRWAQP